MVKLIDPLHDDCECDLGLIQGFDYVEDVEVTFNSLQSCLENGGPFLMFLLTEACTA